jgi:hypothetical protein
VIIIGCLYHYSLTGPATVRMDIRFLRVCRRKFHGCPAFAARHARRGSKGRGLGHMTVWCGTCNAEDRRDTTFYEPPHQVGHNRPLSGWVTRPDALAFRFTS